VIAGYGIALYCMMLVLRTLPVGITYAIWSGLGIVLVALVGAVLYKQMPDLPAIIGMVLIIVGIAVIHLYSNAVH